MMNDHRMPWEWKFTVLVIADEIREKILSGSLDYEFCFRTVDETVNIVDSAILKAYADAKL